MEYLKFFIIFGGVSSVLISIFMDSFTQRYIEGFMGELESRNPGEKEFLQAVREVVESVAPYVTENPQLMDQKILERVTEPD